ncbi:hypothetical protein F7725_019125 [Dissostichus mawsoni]|uniref:PB1 domain-containing protein n=1 Tax=Dissostichus mawsoni TaxID=36200 RepID=A0A7J5XWB6_DISMA|nr:hypothetical protein F7725_019125 [Dissostichus mawsoni]
MGKHKDVRDFDKGHIVMARQRGQIISKTAALVGCSRRLIMLLKVKYQSTKKYIRLNLGFTYLEFINEVKSKFGLSDAAELQIFDETDTAVEEDILLELMEANPDLCLTVRDSFLGEDHSTPSSLTDTMSPSSDNDLSSQREWGAPTGRNVSSFEVITRLPQRFLSRRLQKRTMSRKNRATRSQQAVPATVPQAQGPNRPRSAPTVPHQLDGDACREALSFLVHSPDEAKVTLRITGAQRKQTLLFIRRTQQEAGRSVGTGTITSCLSAYEQPCKKRRGTEHERMLMEFQ